MFYEVNVQFINRFFKDAAWIAISFINTHTKIKIFFMVLFYILAL